MERLQKYIAETGYCSRRKAEELIASGEVTVNGKAVPPSGILVDPAKDTVSVSGKILLPNDKKVYYLLHKPEGYTCSLEDPHALHLVTELIPSDTRVYPVGRLDRDSSGLIIMTNDGELAYRLTHPSFKHEKEYEVYAAWIRALPGNKQGRRLLHKLETGVPVDGKKTAPCRLDVRRFDDFGVYFKIVLQEGRNRQIRKMCEYIGLKVRMLKRIRIGSLTEQGLLPGEYRVLNENEVQYFKKS